MRMVLGLDQQQVLTLLNGFIYHTFFLDAFAGGVPNLMVLHNIILAFGLIGFMLLALQRSLWTPSVIISWLVLILLLVLGSRGSDVLFSPLAKGEMSDVVKGKMYQDQVTTMDNALDTTRWMNSTGSGGAPWDVPDYGAPPGNSAKVVFPTVGDMMGQSIEAAQEMAKGDPSEGGSSLYQIDKIGAFTPMVFVLYTFNTMKKELLSGMSSRISVDILNRSGIANRLGAGTLYPATQFLLRNFVSECTNNGDLSRAMLGGGQINNSPTEIGKIPLNTGKTVEQTLTAKTLTIQNLLNMQRNYFDDIKTPSAIKSFVGMPVGRATMFSTAPPALMVAATNWTAGDSEAVLESYIEGQGKGDDSFYRTMRSNVLKANIAPDDPGLRSEAVISISAYKVLAGKQGTTPTDPGSGIDKEAISFSNCWELYKAYHKNMSENFGGSQVEKRLGKMAFEAETSGMGVNEKGEFILTPGNKQTDSDVVLKALEDKCRSACKYTAGSTNAGPTSACPVCNRETGECNTSMWMGGTASCIAAQKDYVWVQKLVRAGAVDVELGKIAAADEYFRDPKKFSSGARDFTADMGKYLGPIALWFFALFGGFAAGAYSAIVPSFMNFTLMMIFALTPFMFMMGVLMPAWAPQIILTPIVVVAYLKIVEIMFVLVGFVFAALRIGLENAGLITPPSWLMIFKGVDTFNAMYDIMIGMAYTSMFAVAGFMLVGVRSPEKLVGGLASLGDKTGKIDGTEVLKIGAAVGAAGAALKKAGGVAMKGYDRVQDAKFVAGQISEKGLGKGLKDSATALTGSLSERGQKRQLALQGRLDGVDNTSGEYNQQRQQSDLKREKRLLGLGLVDDATAEGAYALEGNKQKQAAASKARTEGALRGAGQGEQVDKERYNRNTGDGSVKGDTLYEAGRAKLVKAVTEKYRSDLKAQGLSDDAVQGKLSGLKAEIQSEVDKFMITSASRLNMQGKKFMDDTVNGSIDYTSGKVVGEFDFSTAEGQAFEAKYGQQMQDAGFMTTFNGTKRLVYNLNKTTKGGAAGAGNAGSTGTGNPGAAAGGSAAGGNPGAAGGGGSAAAGSTPNGGMRSPGGVILDSTNIGSALKERDAANTQRASMSSAAVSAQKIADVVNAKLDQALNRTPGNASASTPAPVAPATNSRMSPVVEQRIQAQRAQKRAEAEAVRQRVTDPANIGEVIKDMQRSLKDIQDDATRIKGDVRDIKNKPKK